jgi:nitrogen fixation protein FixH
MSFIDSIPPRPVRAAASRWRWFPWALIGGLGIVMAVNGYMIATALRTFPGVAGRDGFDLSNDYNHLLAAAARQAALGWKVEAGTDHTGHATLVLTDRTGTGLTGADISATAERPLGPRERTPLEFHAAGAGHYVAADVLPQKGQWDLLLTVSIAGRTMDATRRVILR